MKFNLNDEENNYSVLLIDSSSFFSITPNQHQPPVFFSHSKSAPATSHSQQNRVEEDDNCQSRAIHSKRKTYD